MIINSKFTNNKNFIKYQHHHLTPNSNDFMELQLRIVVFVTLSQKTLIECEDLVYATCGIFRTYQNTVNFAKYVMIQP